jgi:DNA polymerase III sliding clamp (beta) subunit (PCNA family)
MVQNQGACVVRGICGQTGQSKVQSLPVDEFPTVPKVFTGKPFPDSEELRNALHEAMACCSTDATRAVLHGAFLDVTWPKAHYVVATDGRYLYICNSFRLPFEHPIIIPKHGFSPGVSSTWTDPGR